MTAVAAPKVLTVEDDPIVRADLRLILEDAGFDVCPEARDGLEAVELAREHRPDLILIDLALPHLDGVEATRRILNERDVPIVALTGYSQGDFVERAVAAGAAGFVLKPFSVAHLVGVVRGAIGARDAAREREQHGLRVMIESMVRNGCTEPEIARAVRRAAGSPVAAAAPWARARKRIRGWTGR